MSTEPSASFGPVVVRRRLGGALRRLREDAGLRLEQAAAELEVSPSKISRLETGHSIAKTWDVRNLLTVYGVEDSERREEILRWVEESKAVGWWHPFSDASPTDLDFYISLESEADAVSHFCPMIPGLLQTEEYARCALTAMLSDIDGLTDRAIKGLVDIRLRRQKALTRSRNPLKLSVVLDEAALVRRIGDDEVIQAQLKRLSNPGQRVKLRIRRTAAPLRRFAVSPFTIFYPRLDSIDPVIVNIEAAGRDYYLEDPADVDSYSRAFDTLRADSLSESESTDLIRALIR